MQEINDLNFAGYDGQVEGFAFWLEMTHTKRRNLPGFLKRGEQIATVLEVGRGESFQSCNYCVGNIVIRRSTDTGYSV